MHKGPITGDPITAYHAIEAKTERQARAKRDELIVELEMRGLSVGSSLTKKEFPDHRSFVGNPGKVYTKEGIVREVWGEDYLNGSISVPTYNQAHTAED
ncbi:hypothetical protein [Curtanaerobium respiraculi]|uniref:hypothetical protein n=1 Tax=Curtanaerobium respiraculi TaxID=2949669 RepID=UPI0024B3733D|nr:hypothetical protein [Curtanaerobium respiraculi]